MTKQEYVKRESERAIARERWCQEERERCERTTRENTRASGEKKIVSSNRSCGLTGTGGISRKQLIQASVIKCHLCQQGLARPPLAKQALTADDFDDQETQTDLNRPEVIDRNSLENYFATGTFVFSHFFFVSSSVRSSICSFFRSFLRSFDRPFDRPFSVLISSFRPPPSHAGKHARTHARRDGRSHDSEKK